MRGELREGEVSLASLVGGVQKCGLDPRLGLTMTASERQAKWGSFLQ